MSCLPYEREYLFGLHPLIVAIALPFWFLLARSILWREAPHMLGVDLIHMHAPTRTGTGTKYFHKIQDLPVHVDATIST